MCSHGFVKVNFLWGSPASKRFRYSRPMDIIYLHDLKVECIIGIFEWERHVKQTIVLNLDMAADVRRAATSERVEDALDYKAVAKRLIDFVGNSQFQLVETLAETVAGIVLTEFRVPWVRVRVNKRGAVRNAADVGVVIERSRT